MKLLAVLLLFAVLAEMFGLAGRARPHHYVMLTDPWPPRARREPRAVPPQSAPAVVRR
jgi:hypothetical protein